MVISDDQYENQLAQHINFACLQCASKLHLTSFPRQTEFVLSCPCCRRKGRYNLNQLLDDALEEATRTGSLIELSAALQLGADVEVRVSWRGYEMPPAAVSGSPCLRARTHEASLLAIAYSDALAAGDSRIEAASTVRNSTSSH